MPTFEQRCRYCGAEDVDMYRALSGVIVYECEACWRIWNTAKLEKISEN